MQASEVRAARAEELPEVCALFAHVVGDLEIYNERARAAEIAKYSLQHLNELHASDPRFIIVRVTAGRLDAFAITRDDDELLWLSWYGVHPSARGTGASAALLNALLVMAREMGYWKVWCDSRDVNVRSIRSLTNAGFRQICRLERHWFGQDFVLLEAVLAPAD